MPSIPSGQRRQPFFITLSAKAMAYLRISSKMPLTCLKLFHLSDPACAIWYLDGLLETIYSAGNK